MDDMSAAVVHRPWSIVIARRRDLAIANIPAHDANLVEQFYSVPQRTNLNPNPYVLGRGVTYSAGRAQSGLCRPPIPMDAVHLFWAMPTTRCGGMVSSFPRAPESMVGLFGIGGRQCSGTRGRPHCNTQCTSCSAQVGTFSIVKRSSFRLTKTAAEASRTAGNQLHVAVLTVLAETGLRAGELCALTTADAELRPRKWRVIVHEAKGGPYREVPLNAEARN
jgi:hypothetical protein